MVEAIEPQSLIKHPQVLVASLGRLVVRSGARKPLPRPLTRHSMWDAHVASQKPSGRSAERLQAAVPWPGQAGGTAPRPVANTPREVRAFQLVTGWQALGGPLTLVHWLPPGDGHHQPRRRWPAVPQQTGPEDRHTPLTAVHLCGASSYYHFG